MPTITVDEKGARLYYIDSGPVNSRRYTTIVIVHGHTFNGGTFARLLPLAASKAVRLVAINRREYSGSTPYTTEEIDIFCNGTKEQQAEFLRNRGVEILMFLDRFLQENNIPEASEDGAYGGIALLGWSVGSATSLGAVAAVGDIPTDVSQRLGKYLRTNILFEPSHTSLGLVPPSKAYNPLADPTTPREQRGDLFAAWVTGYYTHPDPSPDTGTIDTLEYRSFYEGPDPELMPSLRRISPAEYGSFMDFEPGARSEVPYVESVSLQEILRGQMNKALFDSGINEKWPRMHTALLLCENTVWPCIYSTSEVLRQSRVHAKEPGAKVVHLVFVKKANHFVQLDDPEKAIQAFIDCLGY